MTASPEPSDAELLACDGVAEFGSTLCLQAAALVGAAAAGDVAETEARLRTCRAALTAAIASWREAVPAASNARRAGREAA